MYHTHLNCYVLVLVTLYMSPSPSADVWCKHLSLSRALITLNSFTRPKHANQRGKSRRDGEIVSFFRKKGGYTMYKLLTLRFFTTSLALFVCAFFMLYKDKLFICVHEITY
jgi:hypothetical protein